MESREYDERRKALIYDWCESYGLSKETYKLLLRVGFRTVRDITSISREAVSNLPLTPDQKVLLRGALLQHAANEALKKITSGDQTGSGIPKQQQQQQQGK